MHPASYEVKFYPLNLQIAKQNLKVTALAKKLLSKLQMQAPGNFIQPIS